MTDTTPAESFIRRRIVNTLLNSWRGLCDAWTSEEAFRIETLFAAVLIPLAIALGKNGIETVLLISSVLLVLIVEILNTAIEKTVDRISTERHELSKSIKDLGSAAVLLTLLLAVTIWGVILI